MKIERYVGFGKNQVGFREIRSAEQSSADDSAENASDAKSSADGRSILDSSQGFDPGSESCSGRNCLASSDRLSLSIRSTQLLNLHAGIRRVPEIREERVASIRTSLKDGSYQVTNQQIADAMLRDFRV